MTIPSIKTCKAGHCRFQFPQFKALNADDLRASLLRIIADGADPQSYFAKTYGPKYGNVESTCEVARQALSLLQTDDLVGAATVLYTFWHAEIAALRSVYLDAGRYYLDLIGEVAVFQPCCR